MNSAALPEDLHKLFVEALNSGDLDALVALYAFGAFLMARSGPARGISAIRKALADYAAMKPTIQLTTRAESYKRGTRRCLWQTGDFTEPPPMAEMCQPLVRVSKSLVASRKAVGATSSISPTGSVNPHAENLRRSMSSRWLPTHCRRSRLALLDCPRGRSHKASANVPTHVRWSRLEARMPPASSFHLRNR